MEILFCVFAIIAIGFYVDKPRHDDLEPQGDDRQKSNMIEYTHE